MKRDVKNEEIKLVDSYAEVKFQERWSCPPPSFQLQQWKLFEVQKVVAKRLNIAESVQRGKIVHALINLRV